MLTASWGAARRGYFYAFLCSVGSGAVPSLMKALLFHQSPVVVSGLGLLLSGLILLIALPRKVPPRSGAPFLLFMGVVGGAVSPFLYALGLNQTTVINASLLANGEVLFTTVVAFVFLGERLGRRQAYVGLLIVAGLVVVTTGLDLSQVQLFQGLAGNLLILGSTLGWGVENNVIVVAARRFGSPALSRFRNLLGGGIVTALVLGAGVPLGFSALDAALLVCLGLVFAGVTYLFIRSLELLGAIRMILVYSLSTVFGSIFGLVFFGEQVTLAQLAGGAMILAGVYVFGRSEGKAPPPEGAK